jgi:hypothetical protein
MIMKTIRIFLYIAVASFLFACSEDKMDEINKERNDALEMAAKNILPDIMLKTAFEVAGTDIPWYATVYIEHSAGTWAQSATADKRVAQNDASLFNNNWMSLYDILNACKAVIDKTDPVTGDESTNNWARGIAYVMTAYNLATATDMWGEVPWTEALQGAEELTPKYDKQSFLYTEIHRLLDSAIVNLGKTSIKYGAFDYIYGGDETKWIKAAWSLKARYYLRLSQRDANAYDKALACVANGFAGNEDNFLFAAYQESASGENPWYQFLADRTHLSAGKTLYDLMNDRVDPRIAVYFTQIDGAYNPAPNGTATESQGGLYSTSLLTENGATAPTPLMTYHELKFIQAECLLHKGDIGWQMAMGEAVAANFQWHGITDVQVVTDYLLNNIAPLAAVDPLKELLTQKYIAFYEFEATEAYNDYRRTGVPSMNNPNNLTATGGFVNRFPYAISEVSSNSENVPSIDVFKNKVWWAGGNELVE